MCFISRTSLLVFLDLLLMLYRAIPSQYFILNAQHSSILSLTDVGLVVYVDCRFGDALEISEGISVLLAMEGRIMR